MVKGGINFMSTASNNFLSQIKKGVSEVKKVFYAAMVWMSAFLLVSAGLNETEALKVIPDYRRA